MGLYFNLLTQTKFQITLLTPPTSHFQYYLGNAKQLNLLKATSNADHFSESNPPSQHECISDASCSHPIHTVSQRHFKEG